MYTLADYTRIKKTSTFVLSQETIDIINTISKLVGVEVTIKPEKKQPPHNQITILLNKLTNENLPEIQDKIMSVLSTEPNVDPISSIIFDIASTNSFYSNIYASLYYTLSKKWPILNDLIQLKFNEHITTLTNLRVVDSSNYDEFCNCNAKNDKYRSFSLFVVHLTIKGSIEYGKFSHLIDQLMDLLHTVPKHVVSEVAEHLYILIVKSKPIHNLLDINRTKLNSEGLPNKVVFKLMDILDAI